MLENIDFWSGVARNVYQEGHAGSQFDCKVRDFMAMIPHVRRLYRRTLEMPGMVGCLSISWSFEGCLKVISGKIELFGVKMNHSLESDKV